MKCREWIDKRKARISLAQRIRPLHPGSGNKYKDPFCLVRTKTNIVPCDPLLSSPGTTVLLPCLVMLQRVSRSYKGHQISEKIDTNEEVK